jgi:transposase
MHLSLKKKSDKQTYNKKEICPKLRFGNALGNTKLSQVGVIEAILYRIKTGCQWRELPMKQFFRKKHSWQSVYYHFRKWNADGSIENLWKELLEKNKSKLDLSSIQLDGSHTATKRGGEAVAYQGRKKCKTSNMLFLVDSNGIPIACSEAISGNHNDAYQLEKNVNAMLKDIKKSNISTDFLFLNADAGFDTEGFRAFCFRKDLFANIAQNKRNGKTAEHLFDDLLYEDRFVIERTNAWIDSFKALLIRFETKKSHWKALHLLAFVVILYRQL